MTRLTQYVPNELILKYFVPSIVQQSSSIAFQTRKVSFSFQRRLFYFNQLFRHVQHQLEIYPQ